MLPLRSVFVIALAAAGTAGAQRALPLTFPTSDPTMRRIWAEGMDSSQTERLAQVLLDSIGPRLTGSPGMSASDWVIKKYKSWGIDARDEQYGTWRGWRRGISHIDLVEPRVRSLEGMMLAWSPGTNGGRPVTAEAIVLPKFQDSTEFVRWLPQASGKIVLLSPAWPTCRPSEDWFRFATAEPRRRAWTRSSRRCRPTGRSSQDSAKLYRGTGYSLGLGTGTLGMRLEKAGVAGVITSRTKLSGFGVRAAAVAARGGGGGRWSRAARAGAAVRVAAGRRRAPHRPRSLPPQGTGGWGVIEVFETYNTVAPAVTLSCEDYGLVYRLAENNQKPDGAPRPRRAAARRGAGVQHDRRRSRAPRSRTST